MNNNLLSTVKQQKYYNYEVAGLFTHTKIIMQLLDSMERRLGEKVPLQKLYGSIFSIWSGGRYLKQGNHSGNFKADLLLLQSKNIIPVFTFTNSRISDLDLDDKNGNELLTFVEKNKIDCEVRVVNHLLKKYITTRYPTIKVAASIINIVMDQCDRSEIYYKKLENQWDSYVVHPDDNFNYELLTSLDKEKASILLNERCFYNCPNRKLHYNAIEDTIRTNDYTYQNRILEKCQFVPEVKQLLHNKRNISLSYDEVFILTKLGFKNFKIQGRTDNLYSFIYDIIRYITLDEFLTSQLYIPFCEIIRNTKNS